MHFCHNVLCEMLGMDIDMGEELYSKQVKCSVCNNDFGTMKVRMNACIVDKRDEDFCTHYKKHNPIFYEIFVCPFCGYAASEASFNELGKNELQKLKEVFSGFKVTRSFCEERSINDAIDSFKLALYANKSKVAKDSIIAGTCLKLAWLYRYLGDEKETAYLEFALENYKKAYDVEDFPIGSFDEITIQYLLGELCRRLKKYDEAITWLGKAVMNPERSKNPRTEKMAREQWALVKEEYKKNK